MEIIDLLNPAFKYKWNDVRAARVRLLGGMVQNQPIICGGHNNSKKFKNGIILQSNKELQMIELRILASSVVLDETRLWVSGGLDEKEKSVNSSEFFSLDEPPEDGPKLPFTVSGHCMVKVDSKTIYLIGGSQNNQISG